MNNQKRVTKERANWEFAVLAGTVSASTGYREKKRWQFEAAWNRVRLMLYNGNGTNNVIIGRPSTVNKRSNKNGISRPGSLHVVAARCQAQCLNTGYVATASVRV